MFNGFLSLYLLLCATPVWAEQKVKLTPADSLLPMLGGLLLILLFIFALAYLFRRFTNFAPNSKNIKIIESQMIGPKEKLAIVQVQNQNFLIGITAHSINQLGELEIDLQAAQAEQKVPTQDADAPNFKSVLNNIVRQSIGLKNSSKNNGNLAG